MDTESIDQWGHDHAFGQDKKKSGERRTLIVICITAVMMAVEIAAGMSYGSMALLADGLHMASHASALTISAFAYYFTRLHAHDSQFNFGTGKINSLAAFASATLLAVFALIMAWESAARLLSPVKIEFGQAILIAVIGLAVNGVCLLILKDDGHEHAHDGKDHHDDHEHQHGPADHNLWSAYVHVLADALTSILAILALLAGRYMGLTWMDLLMGVLGAILVMRWSWQLLRASSHVLLDMRAPETVSKSIRERIEGLGGNRISDLHVWSVGPDIFSAEIGVVASTPQEPGYYRKLLPANLNLVHVTVEVSRCAQ